MTAEVLRLERVRKSFGSVNALRSASLTLREGEVVALLGDNGAGKSTLIKAISGVHPVDGGDIYVRGEKASIRSARDAIDLGIETIAPLDFPELRRAASALLRRVGISKKLDADAPVDTLSGGERQSIAISRAMQFAAKVIILDEPTNNLGVEETHGVLRFVKEVRDAGHTVLFITHNIHHVFQVADRIVVMRRGEIVAERAVEDTDLLTVESLIMGVDVSTLVKEAKAH
jgi:simple sugar transport system ATP-binding protein